MTRACMLFRNDLTARNPILSWEIIKNKKLGWIWNKQEGVPLNTKAIIWSFSYCIDVVCDDVIVVFWRRNKHNLFLRYGFPRVNLMGRTGHIKGIMATIPVTGPNHHSEQVLTSGKKYVKLFLENIISFCFSPKRKLK